MIRREFITLLGGAAAYWPLAAAHAQPGERMRRVGVLVGLGEDDPEAKTRFAGFRQGFEKLGWFEGRNVRFEFRYAPAGARVQEIAQELIALQPDVILAQGTPISAALKRETGSVPVVFVGNVDPVGSGFVESLARPGGNLTGFLSLDASITGKWLTMLKEIDPRLSRVALVANPRTIPYDYYFAPGLAVAPSLGIELVPGHVENPVDIERVIDSIGRAAARLTSRQLEVLYQLVPKAATIGVLINPNAPIINVEPQVRDLELASKALGVQLRIIKVADEPDANAAFATFAAERADAVFVTTDALFSGQLRDPLVTLAARYRLPAIYPWRDHVTAGGLIAYTSSLFDAGRQAGVYAGRILKGAKPAELPVTQPTKFELVVNLKAAKALGLEVPDKLIAIADEVIE